MSKQILTEGGLAGHIIYLYDDLELTFGKLKEIISRVSDGSIELTEKLDGYNLFMTMRNGQCYVARNKSEIGMGGIDINQLSSRQFQGGQDVARVFWEAASVFENAFSDYSKQEMSDIFGEQGNVFFSFEILTKDEQNLINYDSNMLVLLPLGHIIYDFSKNSPTHDDVSKFYDKFVDSLEALNEKSKDLLFTFSKAPKLTNVSSDLSQKILSIINKLQKEASLNDFSKLKEYYKFNIKKNLSKLSHFDIQKPEIKDIIADLVVGDKKTSDIPSNFNETDRNFVAMFSKTSKNSKKILEISKWPLEKAIHDYSVAYLNQIENHDERFKNSSVVDTLKRAIKAIKAYNGEDADLAKSILNKNLSKISKIDEINEYIEGIVFEYDGNVYKLTGNFGPVNQIVNLYKFGRGKIPSLCFKNDEKSSEIDQNTEKSGKINEEDPSNVYKTSNQMPNNQSDPVSPDASVALFAGSFKPPHAGHYKAVRKLLESKTPEGELMVKKITILISPKPRYSNDYKIFVDADKSEEVWRAFIQNESRVEIQICEKSPVQTVFDIVKADERGDKNFIIVTSQKDKETRYQNLKEYAGPDVNIKMAIVPNYNEIDASKVRQCLSQNDYDSFKNFMPIELNKDVIRNIWSSLKNQTYNAMYDKFSNNINNTPVYAELSRRYPTLSKDREFVSSVVLKEETRQFKDRIKGGLADRKQPTDFDEEELIKGIKVEMEHTDNMLIAKEIAMDHLMEDPFYYKKLQKAGL